MPNLLLEIIVTYTSHELQEFTYHGKRIVFTADIVRKVFNISSGNKHVDLIKKKVMLASCVMSTSRVTQGGL
jgi:hypothetical protein